MNRLRPDEFLRDCWQKQPLFLRQAVPDGLPQLDPDELAWLATLEDVESRLVFTQRDGDRCRYRVQHGPFAENEIRQLPERDWTLLVNDVEKHLPELRSIVDLVEFLPDPGCMSATGSGHQGNLQESLPPTRQRLSCPNPPESSF